MLRNIIKKYALENKKTILVTSHVPEDLAICDRLMFLYQGEIVFIGTKDELYAPLKNRKVLDLKCFSFEDKHLEEITKLNVFNVNASFSDCCGGCVDLPVLDYVRVILCSGIWVVPVGNPIIRVLEVIALISPLLGLLGTVTGMISTFHVITLYGTGDPRMMSGGISEALVTTMLGLAVAIPIMLMHTFLSRRVEHIIGDMEEKAVALTNIIYREITVIE